MKKPKALQIYLEYSKQIEKLSDEQAGRLFKGVMCYGESGFAPDFSDDVALDILFSILADRIDADFENYNVKCERASVARKQKSDDSTLKNDESTLKSDVSMLKDDVSTLKSDESTLKQHQSQTQSQTQTQSQECNTHSIKGISCEIPCEIADEFADFEKMRKAIKKPLTSKARSRALKKLQQLAPDNYDEQRKILNQSVDHCWCDVFPVGSNAPPKNKSAFNFANDSYDSRKHKSLFEE